MFLISILNIKEWIRSHWGTIRYLLWLLLIGFVIMAALSWYDVKLKEQYDAGRKLGQVETNNVWQQKYNSMLAHNNEIVLDVLKNNTDAFNKFQSSYATSNAKVAKIISGLGPIYARDANGNVQLDKNGTDMKCYLGNDFTGPWNTITQTYHLDGGSQ